MINFSENQKKIISFCENNNGKITKKEACNIIRYYHNTQKHVGDILSRMVNMGYLKRIKRGSFEIQDLNTKKQDKKCNDINQLNFFESGDKI